MVLKCSRNAPEIPMICHTGTARHCRVLAKSITSRTGAGTVDMQHSTSSSGSMEQGKPFSATESPLVDFDAVCQKVRAAVEPARAHAVSLHDEHGDVLWLSESSMGPDEHNAVREAVEAFSNPSGAAGAGLRSGRLALRRAAARRQRTPRHGRRDHDRHGHPRHQAGRARRAQGDDAEAAARARRFRRHAPGSRTRRRRRPPSAGAAAPARRCVNDTPRAAGSLAARSHALSTGSACAHAHRRPPRVPRAASLARASGRTRAHPARGSAPARRRHRPRTPAAPDSRVPAARSLAAPAARGAPAAAARGRPCAIGEPRPDARDKRPQGASHAGNRSPARGAAPQSHRAARAAPGAVDQGQPAQALRGAAALQVRRRAECRAAGDAEGRRRERPRLDDRPPRRHRAHRLAGASSGRLANPPRSCFP